MRLAIPIWRDRVSPVFDVAQQLLVVDLSDDKVASRALIPLRELAPAHRLRRLQDLHVQTLVCCAISRPLREVLVSAGIAVHDAVCGNVAEIVVACQNGTLADERFAMPGCRAHQDPAAQKVVATAEPPGP